MLVKRKVVVVRRAKTPAGGWTVDKLIGILMHRGARGFTWRELSREYRIAPNDMSFHSGLCLMYEKLRKTGNVRSEYQELRNDICAARELRYFYVPNHQPETGTTKGIT